MRFELGKRGRRHCLASLAAGRATIERGESNRSGWIERRRAGTTGACRPSTTGRNATPVGCTAADPGAGAAAPGSAASRLATASARGPTCTAQPGRPGPRAIAGVAARLTSGARAERQPQRKNQGGAEMLHGSAAHRGISPQNARYPLFRSHHSLVSRGHRSLCHSTSNGGLLPPIGKRSRPASS
jgi:hypothetical protein